MHRAMSFGVHRSQGAEDFQKQLLLFPQGARVRENHLPATVVEALGRQMGRRWLA